jgi:RNA polymerase sigma factor (sigma-70 family)
MLTFRELYSRYFQDVFRFSYWLSGSRADAEDLTSETFVRAWTNVGRIRTKTLKGYLIRIARNVYLGEIRRRRREEPMADPLPDPVAGPEAEVELQEDLARLLAMLDSLAEQERSAFLMRTLHEMEYAEIARVLHVSEGAARVKVHRARKALIANRIRLEGER